MAASSSNPNCTWRVALAGYSGRAPKHALEWLLGSWLRREEQRAEAGLLHEVASSTNICSTIAALPRDEVFGLSQVFRTNIFPGNWRISRFISRLSSATDTAELGKPLFRITSSMLISSLLRVS
jgi:hypothetical protein